MWALIQERARLAQQHGAIYPIQTSCEVIEDRGIPFIIRLVVHLAYKEIAVSWPRATGRTADSHRVDPFFPPYDPYLYVTDISVTHVCLLNKFNVLDHHILIVTRDFEDQTWMLTVQDFEALRRCMTEFPGLGFYNSGPQAGASQSHRHLQMVPLPLTPESPVIPIERAFQDLAPTQGLNVLSRLPFAHVLATVDPQWWKQAQTGAQALHNHYEAMLTATGLLSTMPAPRDSLPPYNLLVTQEWMLLVPRSQECFEGISINALGFAGMFLVKDQQQHYTIKQHGPLKALQHVGIRPMT
ncbi:MAG: phosphorylase [Nitrospirae bacterium]|nr:MAG: phosphorylase [Nitrospirota bacterium]